MINKIISPFNFKENTIDMNIKEKLIVILYFPVILIMWYGYYMWNNQEVRE